MTQDVGVFFELYRPSDGAVSDPKAFRYKPSGKTRLGKRARFEAPLVIRFFDGKEDAGEEHEDEI